jgi:two-component system chemotaxis response regulator CheY
MTTATLATAGYDVATAENGVRALEYLSTESVDLIISDVNMNLMGGFEFVMKLRARASFDDTPILFLTTEDSEDFKRIGREIGATGWLTKPFDPGDLLRVVQRVLA